MRIFKLLGGLLLLLSFMSGISLGYEGYGFSKYQENGNNISFSCNNHCYIKLGQKDKIDYLSLQGDVNGNGSVGYGFDGWELLNRYKINLKSNIDEYINFFDDKRYLSEISNETDLILSFNGKLNGYLRVEAGRFSLSQKIKQWWGDFCEIETFNPYSVNLRYGIIVNGVSIIKYGYVLFIIIAILVLLFKQGRKEQKCKFIFYVGIGLFLFVGIRNTITYTVILHQGLSGFREDKTYFDLGDYIGFTDEVRKELKLDVNKFTKDDCKIYINSYQDLPFVSHWESFYLKPCERVFTGEMADYIIYYKSEISNEDLNKKILISHDYNYLLENNPK